MKRTLFLIGVWSLTCGAALPLHAAQPWLAAVGDHTVICCSPKADPLVRQAAEAVLAELQKVRPDATMLDPRTLTTDYATLGTHHVICVGQWADNEVLRMTWGHWANSREERDWNAKGDQRAMELADLWAKDIPAQDWRWQHDFFAFGYGDFDGNDVGYVQTVRNPFGILLRTVPGQTVYDINVAPPFDQAPANQMYFMIHLTGTGPAGVVKAVDAFLKDGVLNGVMPGAGAKLPDDWKLVALGAKQLGVDLPAWAPVAGLPDGVQYLGQQMAGSHLYGGFMEASGVRPQRLWRLKYHVTDGFRFFDSYPTNRASGNELLIAECPDANDAKAAAAAVRKSMPADPPRVTWEYGGHSYAIYGADSRGMLTWPQAKNFCEKLGGHLITLGSKGEQDALAAAIERSGAQNPTVFIGLSGDWHKNQWAWVTGEPIIFRGWLTQDGKEVYGKTGKRGDATREDKMPAGPVQYVRFTCKYAVYAGWYVDEGTLGAFVCEWDKGGAASRQSAPVRAAVRDQYVLMQSFDDPAGEAVLRKGMGQ